jgi:folate-binding protein YgfZ
MNDASEKTVDGTALWSGIVARGPESDVFLQGQLSQDISSLSTNGGWALLLAPDSVVITSCFVTPNPDGFTLAVPRALGDVALARLRRFLLRTKCTLELIDLDAGPFSSVADRIAAGQPGPEEFEKQLTPHTFGASFVRSTISFTKGCFTGQELVGRLDARGSSVPWRLVRASGPSEDRVNEVLHAKGPAGTSGLTSVTSTSEGIIGLAIAHRTLLGSDELALASDVNIEAIA